MKGETYQMPVSSWDEFGCRVMVVTHEMEIGDIELKETRHNTMNLMQYICAGMIEIIHFFTARPSANPSFSSPVQQPHPANPALSLSPTSLSSLPQTTGNVQRNMPGTGVVNHSTGGQSTVVFSEPFVVLCQRYIIAICNCKDIFQVDKTRTKQQVGIWLNIVDIFLYYYQYDM